MSGSAHDIIYFRSFNFATGSRDRLVKKHWQDQSEGVDYLCVSLTLSTDIMAACNTNTDIIEDSSENTPCCLHGPALLFERYTKAHGIRKFYACSAFRDHKLCGFFRWADEVKKSKEGDNTHSQRDCDRLFGLHVSHSAYRKRFLQFKKQPLSKRSLCCTCGLFLLADEVADHEGKGHEVKHRITRSALQHPTTLFHAQKDEKTFAQYLFADSTVQFIVDSLQKMDVTHVLCVGAPRVHEAISLGKKSGDTQLTSLLMDLDSRYAQVYSSKTMCRYNMFNHHFFDAGAEERFKSFVQQGGGGLILVTDPPFGGMVQALAASFLKIEATWRALTNTDKSLPILWFFPYFMEKRVCQSLPSLTMHDYKVDYDNHNLFQTREGKRKKGSPVRIFSNLPPVSLPLPASLGYWFCERCQRYSGPENQHCNKCDACTSKDGTTYVHCEACERCVKSTRVHCKTCGVCELPDHVCGQQRGQGCYICGELEHKRLDCPQRHTSKLKPGQGKRQSKHQAGNPRKKARRK